MLVEVEGGRKVQQNLHLSCTYEGTRQHLGRIHASVPIVGVARSKEGQELGKVTGHALFDVEGGFIRSIQLQTRSEVESGDSDIRIMVIEETRLTREEGNPQRLALPGN